MGAGFLRTTVRFVVVTVRFTVVDPLAFFENIAYEREWRSSSGRGRWGMERDGGRCTLGTKESKEVVGEKMQVVRWFPPQRIYSTPPSSSRAFPYTAKGVCEIAGEFRFSQPNPIQSSKSVQFHPCFAD